MNRRAVLVVVVPDITTVNVSDGRAAVRFAPR
jgi:hypothetical protein